jgi:hypothetical protein
MVYLPIKPLDVVNIAFLFIPQIGVWFFCLRIMMLFRHQHWQQTFKEKYKVKKMNKKKCNV